MSKNKNKKINTINTMNKNNTNNNDISKNTDIQSIVSKEIDKKIEEINKNTKNTIVETIKKMSNIEKKHTKTGVIGIPHMGTFPWQTFTSFLNLKRPANTIIKHHLIGSSLVYDARDKIIEFAIKENADWVMFVDSDMILPDDIILKFNDYYLEDKKANTREKIEIIGGMAFKRTYPFQPCFYTKARINPKTKKPELESPIEFGDKGVLPCEGLGMACTLIQMSAIKKIKKFQEDKGQEVNYFFPFPGVGEDLSFCLRARMAGIKMYTDLSVNVGHVSSIPIYKENFIMAYEQYKKDNTGKPLFQE